MKKIDLNKSVAELVHEYPELKEILAELGFTDIMKPAALKLMGRIMTLPRGAVVKGIPMEKIRTALAEKGFTVVGAEEQQRQTLLREYVGRLNRGESLESVRADFVRNFEHVDAAEIADAEQDLIKGGVPLKDVQKLCDVHAALFHDRKEMEKAELQAIAEKTHKAAAASQFLAEEELPEGHPLSLLKLENTELTKHLDAIAHEMTGEENVAKITGMVAGLNAVRLHYAKKEELLMPMLYDYGVTGPSQVMWGVDDEIKRELGTITKALKEDAENYPLYKGRINQVCTRIREMVFKEERILFPLSLRYFTQEQWYEVYRDLFEMGMSFVDVETMPRWPEGEKWLAAKNAEVAPAVLDGKVKMPTGELTVRQLQGILKLIDVDITFIDKDDIVRYFLNEGKVFSRPLSALGREVYSCHPPEIIPVVRQMLFDFKAKKRTHMEVWRRIMGRPIGVRYMAVYDDDGEYIGTVEFVQDYQKALDKFKK
ncbi:DUF438 domain-containing protein [uncultured Mitsuokella sp.]|uniref:DUF438 domain-containing protein n=1 Tax=uncultured Mitsuokella sp. TaxID=453120 RepID=UPI0025D07C75|nr:DUF438 domain-containing protein [uncultured Mitsuokella sp.]